VTCQTGSLAARERSVDLTDPINYQAGVSSVDPEVGHWGLGGVLNRVDTGIRGSVAGGQVDTSPGSSRNKIGGGPFGYYRTFGGKGRDGERWSFEYQRACLKRRKEGPLGGDQESSGRYIYW
jgi:hypothetical protein